MESNVEEITSPKGKKAKRKGRGRINAFFFNLIAKTCILFTVFMLIIMFTPLSNYMASMLTVPMIIKKVELTAVLGGGAYRNSVLSASSSERLLHGLRLHKQGLSEKIVFVGGTILDSGDKLKGTLTEAEHKDGAGLDVVEASLMKSVAEDIGVNSSDILLDIESANTYENMRAVKAIMEERDYDTCMIVTSPMHMLRAIRVSRKLAIDCTPAPVGDYTSFVDDPVGRLVLMRSVLKEFAALFIYKAFGYI